MVAYDYEANKSIMIPERWHEIITAYEVVQPTGGVEVGSFVFVPVRFVRSVSASRFSAISERDQSLAEVRQCVAQRLQSRDAHCGASMPLP
jgi:hypothetical protein